MLYGGTKDNQKLVLGHPSGLFVLFFTEMWERFSYYGMRALLVLFLVTAVLDGGWGWDRADALVLYAWYTGLVYLSPSIGGLIGDKYLGYRKAIVLGAALMALGHIAMAFEVVSQSFLYIGLLGLIVGNGFFKPNIASIVGNLYKNAPKKRDAGYTIFYMGVNAGAFLGILLCGYIGEKVGWHYGFGLAGIFMIVGLLQFYYAQSLFGKIGLPPIDKENLDDVFEDEVGKIQDSIVEVDKTIKKSKIEKDRLIVICVLAFFTIFFWWAFEQAGGSMTVFAKDYTNRVLEGNGALIFKIFNTTLTVIPMLIITWVLKLLFKQTFENFSVSNIILGIGFAIIWALVIWMLVREFNSEVTEVPASWYGILNSFYIIALAPYLSKLWESKYNPTAPIKFAIGLILLGLGFGILSYGSMGIPLAAKSASVSMIFLILAYLFHTLGELFISPVGLSYISQLAPARLLSLMFGIWYFSNFIANTAAGITGSYIDPIVESQGMSKFFLIFTIIPLIAGVILVFMNKWLLKLMHGIR